MKKTLIILASMLCISINGVQAQSLLDALKGLKSNTETQTEDTNTSSTKQNTSSTLSTIGNILTGLLGTDNVNSNSIVGTWTYKQPAIVFGSDNLLTNVGAMAAGKTVESKLQTYLNKIGFTAGKVKMQFKEDGTGTVTYAQKDIPFQWTVEGSEMTLKLGSGTLGKLASSFGKNTSSSKQGKYSSFKLNCKMGLNSMQLSFKADKLMDFISKILSATGKATNNSTISTITGLANQVDEMYLGLTLEK